MHAEIPFTPKAFVKATSSKQITVLLAEDHSVVQQSRCALLNMDGDFLVAGEARTGQEAVEMAMAFRPDVILMDIAMPGLNGLEAAREILAANPGIRVVIRSAHSDDGYLKRMKAAGVAGVLEKQAPAAIVVKAIHAVAEGQTFFRPSIIKYRRHDPSQWRDRNGSPEEPLNRLTPREFLVLRLVAEGSTNRKVAAELGISIKTVEKHRQHLMSKLNIRGTAGLTRYWITSVLSKGASI